MLKHLRSSVLCFALLAQFVHAQRTGTTFSIVSESTGSLFAEGNTTSTSFSQIGGSEPLQGTFSTTTTNVSGTLGFLGQASTVSANPATTFTVAGGQGTSPYYNFTDGNGQTPDFGTLLLNRGTTYEFSASGVSTSHPFMIGESYGDMNSSLTSGGPLTGTGGKITLTIPADFNGSLYYFCTNHGAMIQEFTIRQPNHTADLNASVAMEMIWVQPGSFTMGQDGVVTPVHEVTLTQGFYLGKYEVTQAQYEAVMTGNTDGLSATPSNWPNNPDRPVEKVSHDDIQKFLTRLNAEQAGNVPAGWSYVLPTEAQWEYACRAGTTTAYSWGDSITADNANFSSSGYSQTRDVGLYAANPWGFFDMHGNVLEWTADRHGLYNLGAQTDPKGPATGSRRVHRGGSWHDTGTSLRSAGRSHHNPSFSNGHIGFRVGFQIQPDEASPELELFGGADIPHKRDEPWAEPGYGASDVRDGNLTSSVSISGTVDVNTTGTYTITYTVTDAAGNEVNATRTVRVMDYIPYDASSLDGALNTISNSGATHVGVEGPEGQDFLLNHPPVIPSGLNVIFQSDQDLYILKPFTYSGEQTITLSAGGSIFVQASISASHSDGKLAAHYGLSEPSVDNPHFFIVAQPINLEMGENFFSQHGMGGEYKSYQIIHELNGSIQSQPNLDYALGMDINTSLITGFSSLDKTNDFEGLGHKIGDNLGTNLFGSFSNGKIANLALRVQGEARAILANSITNARIVNVHLEGTISSVDRQEKADTQVYANQMGAVAGISTNSKIFFSSANVTITGSSYLGGLLGSADSTDIHQSFAFGTVTGIATGYSHQSYDYADPLEIVNFHSSNVGGFIGRATFSTIKNSYSGLEITDNEITGPDGSGSGYEDINEFEWYQTGYLETSESTNYFLDFGALVGFADADSNVSKTYSNMPMSYRNINSNTQNSIDNLKTDSELKTKSTYTDAGWDFDKTWHMTDGEYPFFKWNVPYVDQPPSDLNSTTELTVTENQPVGTILGKFNATDPEGGAIRFQLVEGDNNNSLFSLDINGTLKTATVLDYETNASTYTITVQAKDELNATTEGNFTVTLLDILFENWSELKAVGLHSADVGEKTSAGLVEIYHLGANGSQSFVSEITAPSPQSYGEFGKSISRYENILATCAPSENVETAEGAGKVYLYSFENNGTVTFLSEVVAPNLSIYGYFGLTVSLFENYLVVGQQSPYVFDKGSVYIFRLTGDGSTTFLKKISAPGDFSGNSSHPSGGTFGNAFTQSTDFLAVHCDNSDVYIFDKTSDSVNLLGKLESPEENFLERLSENQAPTSISANSELSFPEHQPVGTIISSFAATDPDVTSSITFHLVSGVGDDNNSLFNLEANGTLSTASSFDFESQDSNYSILVMAKDEYFGTLTQQFTISLLDIDEGTMPVDGNGSKQNPYLIANLANLKWITYNPSSWSSHFLQTADINASETRSWEEGKGFRPIGNYKIAFTGSFNGDHNKIFDLYINRPNQLVGLFGYAFYESAGAQVIENIVLQNIEFIGATTGSIIGEAFNWVLLRNSSSVGANLKGSKIGGLVGSWAMGGNLIQSHFEGYIDANQTAGGIIGSFDDTSLVSNYAIVEFALSDIPKGGLAGSATSIFAEKVIEQSFSISNVPLYGNFTIDEYIEQGTPVISFWDSNISNNNPVLESWAVGKTTQEMKTKSTFADAGWDFNDTWFMPESGYPILRWQVPNNPPTDLNSTAALTIAENQPIGTIVGEFNATDPEGGAITYHLVNGENNNSLFTLETNGMLKTATTFDYESNASTYTITVQAEDELNASIEGNFTVTLEDTLDTQSIAWGQDFSGVGVGQTVDLNASATSGLAVHYSVSDTSVAELAVTNQSSLQAWYKLDETSGDASDSSTNSNTGSLRNVPTYNTGKFGNAITLDGTDDHVRTYGYTGINGTAGRTISLWFKTSIPGKPILQYGDNTPGSLFQLSLNPSGSAMLHLGDTNITSSTTGLADGKWHHLAVSFPSAANSGAAKLYVDNNLTNGAGSTTINTSSGTDVVIGRGGTAGIRYFNGQIDDVRFYDGEMNSTLISQLYGNGNGDFNRLKIKAAGTITITASQPGNSSYAPAPSTTLSATFNKSDQTISFDVIPTKSVGDFNFIPTAVASSGLDVSFTSSDSLVAQVLSDGRTIKIRSAGSATITANQAGNSAYNAATAVTQTLTVGYFNLQADSFPGIRLWLDGNNIDGDDTADTITDGAAIIQWIDQSGNNNHPGQATAGNRPTYGAAELNGKGVVNFTAAESFELSGDSNIRLIAAVLKQDSSQSAVTKPFGGNQNLTTADQKFSLGAIDSGLISTTYRIVVWQMVAGDYSIHVDGTNKGSSTSSLSPDAFDKMGNDLVGSIAEVVAYDRALSDGVREKLEGSLAHKWGLNGSLASSHTYKNTKPAFGGTQIISFPPLSSTQVGQSVSLNVSSDSGLTTFIFESNDSTVVSFEGNVTDGYTVRGLNTGQVTITATQPGQAPWNSVTATQSFTVVLPIPREIFTVTGGQGTFPYYTITDSLGQSVNFSGSKKLISGTTYEFVADNVSGSHPFMIGESYGDTSSSLVSGGPLTGTGGKIILTIPEGHMGDLYYFCTNHSGMIQQFMVHGNAPLTDSNFHDAISLWFDAEENATAIYGHISDWNTSVVTNMSGAFENRYSFNEDITSWDTTSVTNMSNMFFSAQAFAQNVGDWDTSSVTTMSGMFFQNDYFGSDLSSWDTSSVTSMSAMFNESGFSGDISSWDTSLVTDMSTMFERTSFNSDISDWNVTSVTNFTQMFNQATDGMTGSIKGKIHEAFSPNPNWPYNWSEFVNYAPTIIFDDPDKIDPNGKYHIGVDENQTFVMQVAVTDVEGDEIVFSIHSGLDADFFQIDSNSGVIEFKIPPDYEAFEDNRSQNKFDLKMKISDGTNEVIQGVDIWLSDIYEDTDGDGYRDSLEFTAGSDLNDPNSTPLQRGLVAWYPFDGNASDMSGNGNHGTVYGATLGTDRHGAADKAYSFDGVDDYINLGNSLLPTNGDDWTASMWVNNPRANSTHGLLLAQYNGGAGRFQFFSDGDYKLSIFSSNMTGSTELPGFSLGMQENWNLLHLISLGNKISLYENGILRVSDVTIADIAETDTMIGNDGNAGRWLIGSIDDVRIYDRALFEEEIQLLYEDEAELPEQSVTSAKISPALSDLIDGNGSLEQALPAGSVIARKPGEAPPPGYTLFQRNEYNASLVWEEKAPLSMARYAFDGADVIDGKIYFTGMVGGDGSPGSTLLERYDPATNSWETLANRPKPRYAPCTTVLNGKYYVMGGRLDDGIVEVYDPVTNSWSEGEPMPVQVNHCSAVTYAGKIYVIGNNRAIAFDLSSNEWSLMAESGLTTYGTCLAIYEDRIWSFTEEGVESYDPLTDTWQTESSPSVNRQFGTTWTYDGKLYFACGRISGTAKYNTIESYDPKNQNWVKIGEFVDKREVLDSVLIDDRVYLVGGHAITINGNEHVSSMFSAQLPLVHPMNLYFKEGNATAEAELSTLGMVDGSLSLGQFAPDALAKIGLDHNPATAEGSLLAVPRGEQPPPGYALYKRSDRNGSLVWEEKAPVSVARRTSHGVAVFDGELYFVGGESGTGALSLVEKYNPLANQWVTLNPLSVPRKGTSVAVLNGNLYAIGGAGLSSVEIFDPQNNQWTEGPSLPSTLENATAITYNDKIFLIGGVGPTGAFLDQVLCLDLNTNTWTQKASMQTERSGLNLVLFEDEIWAIGGGNLYSASVDSVEAYNVENNTWATKESLSTSRRWAAAWSYDGKINSAGGRDSTHNFLSSIEVFDKNTNQWEVIQSDLPVPNYFVDAAVIDGTVYLVAGHNGSVYFDDLYAADITPPMDLYYREANASGTITLDKLSTELAAEFASSTAVSTPVGLVSAVDYDDDALSDHTILERTDRNATHEWEEMAPIPTSLQVYDGIEVVDGKIYCIGGNDGSSALDTTYRYDPVSGSWETLASMQLVRSGMSSAVLDGKVYAISGQNAGYQHLTVEVYNPSTNQWTYGPQVSQMIRQGAAITIDGRLFVMGGIDPQNSNSSSNLVWELNEERTQWISRSSMPVAKHGIKLVAFEGKILVYSGNVLQVYHVASDAWEVKSGPNISQHYPVFWKDNNALFMGGGISGDSFLTSSEKLDLNSFEWTSSGDLPEPKYVGGSVVDSGRVYILGGKTTSENYTNKVYAADLLPHRDLYFRSIASETLNRGPVSIFALGDLNISENQPVGTIVGEFNATDPEGGVISYSLGTEDWETFNNLFTLDENGTLRTASVLDYESIDRWKKIRVVATDEAGASITEMFSVTIEDINDAPTAKSSVVEYTIPEGRSWSSLTWDRVYGGVGKDSLAKMIPAHGGGYLLAGSSDSNISYDKTEDSRGGKDFWLVKIDEGGDVLWDKRYGGSEDDNCSGIIPTGDGNYLLYGASASPADGDKTEGSQGYNDFWIVKIDENGSKIWDKRYGGGAEDKCLYALELENGDFALSGYSRSGISGDKTHGSMGHTDSWLIRVDENGSKIWDYTYGGDIGDFAIKVEVASDGNWLVCGHSSSNPGSSKTASAKGGDDYWAIKVNVENGSMIWDKSYGGESYDYFDDALVQEDGSFIMVGLSYAASGNTGDRQSTAKGESSDLWVVKADANGSILWEHSYGGEKGVGWDSRILSIDTDEFLISSAAKGIAAADISGGQRNTGDSDSDYWLIKIDQDGNKIWDRRYGGGGYEDSISIIPANDGGFLLGGGSYAMAGFDKTHARYSLGSWIGDYWVLKLDEHGNKANTLYDPEGDELTLSISGGADASYFEINATTGKIAFTGADYANPQDADENNQYEVIIRATDSSGLYAEQVVRVVIEYPFDEANGDEFLDAELVAWYPFDGNASDMSGNGNDGTLYGPVPGVDRMGVADKALSFDGTDDRVQIPHTLIDDRVQFTYNLWYKSTDASEPYAGFISAANTHSYAGNLLLLEMGKSDRLELWDSGSAIVKGDVENRSNWVDHWRMITLVREPYESQIFLDGKPYMEAHQPNTSLDVAENGLWIGPDQDSVAGGWDSTQHLTGSVDDVRVYHRALSKREVELLYQATSPNHFVDSAKDLEMIWVEPGTFTMGQSDISNASPEHNVTLTTGFYLGKYEITQAQYEAVMSGNTETDSNGNVISATPSQYGGNPDRPVEKVSWEDIQVFLTRLNEQQSENLPNGWAYVLPTEAQWEYACRAGTTTAYSWGDTISSGDANYNWDGAHNTGADFKKTRDVGQYSANQWGFFDMHGNVWEWTADALGSYAAGAQTDPFNAGTTGYARALRGGSWIHTATELRSAQRNSIDPGSHRATIGFRVGFQKITEPPTDLNSTTALTVAENQPIGTIVGEFNATDPEGGTVIYSLVSGEGGTHNSLFVLDEFTGVLSTNEPLIYDIHGPYLSIRIRAFDELGAWMDGVFTIQLIEEEVMEPPRDFSLSNNRILENRPVGTLVGTFYVPLEDTFDFEYFLVSGSGDTGNQYFKLSSDGKLTTFVQFDYESKRGTSVRVSIQNKKGEAVEKVFQLMVENDTARAIVRTIPPKFRGRTLKVAGQLEDAGEISSEEKVKLGILVSNRPIRGGTSDKRAKRFDLYEGPLMLGAFGTNYSMPQGWRKAYVLAFAETFEGTSYGLLEVFEVPVNRSVDSWIGATALTASTGWWESPWLGTFYKSEESGWMLHLELGWVYPSPGKDGSLWLWKENLEWVWTDEKLYPFLFSATESNWMYFYGSHNQMRLFYHYGENKWIDLDDSNILERQGER